MPIQYLTKPMTAEGTSAAVEHHAIARVELAVDLATMMVMLEQWPTEQARINGATPSGYWQVQIDTAALDLTGGLAEVVRAAIVSAAPFVGGVWAPTADGSLDVSKVRRWSAIKAERRRHVAGTFTAAGKTYNCNREAITLATHGAMLAKAALDLTWTKTWTLADNTSATLTADQVLTVARAFDDYIGGLWVTGRTLRAQIAAATTIAQVEAITWP